MTSIWRDDLAEPQLAVMRKAGLVLAAVGLVDLASCILTVSRGGHHSSSLNIFALFAGLLVYRGSARAARFVVRGLSFLLGGFILVPLPLIAANPWRLLLLQIRLSAWSFIQGAAMYLALVAVLFWVRHLLGGLRIHAQGEAARPLHRSIAAWIGAGIPICLAVVLPVSLASDGGRRAAAEARRQLGPGYSFHVQQLSTWGGSGRAVVAAYTDSQLRYVTVQWDDN